MSIVKSLVIQQQQQHSTATTPRRSKPSYTLHSLTNFYLYQKADHHRRNAMQENEKKNSATAH
jgi:hypothetical protein